MSLDASVSWRCWLAKDAGYHLAKIEMSKTPIFYSSLAVFEAVISLARIIAISHNGNQAPTPPDIIELAQESVAQFLEQSMGNISGSLHRAAIEAARNYGRFVGHPARLNFGDCFAYACAKSQQVPLLFKGDDFSRTEIDVA
ncbi:twitching motility protein PilT [Ensifer sp. Root31]|uniref:type II toxin-antitoxin system VapC family toxin n=1 Tax=Ensifer sp. Root31 TaxID=1736512 RepID=UPI000710FCFF|nr:type II toxin-antitoxin system VapC family toxin [Ensifer sp. Root31]KQU97760.1 twitching motility protein PilT [Ensifer sp. Root31]